MYSEMRLLSLLLRTFFRYESDLNSYTHQRIDAEIRKYQRKAASARGANQIRWTLEKDKKSDLNSDTDQILTNNHKPITNNHKKSKYSVEKPENVDQRIWDDFILIRKNKKAPLTEAAWNGIVREANKAGFTLNAALQEICERNWTAFKADWVTKSNPVVQLNGFEGRGI